MDQVLLTTASSPVTLRFYEQAVFLNKIPCEGRSAHLDAYAETVTGRNRVYVHWSGAEWLGLPRLWLTPDL